MDTDQYGAAADLDRQHPRWWVLWGPYSRRYWAFHLGEAAVGPVDAPNPRALRRHITDVERELAIPPVARWRSAPQPPLE